MDENTTIYKKVSIFQYKKTSSDTYFPTTDKFEFEYVGIINKDGFLHICNHDKDDNYDFVRVFNLNNIFTYKLEK